MISKVKNLLSLYKKRLKFKKISYSLNAVDLIIDYAFKSKKKGIYLDVGAQNPISNNNTYLLFKRGWSGINIDLDSKNIDLFNLARPHDINLNYAISSNEDLKDLYFYHDKSPLNTLNEFVSNFQKAKIKEIKKQQTITLNELLKRINFHEKIDYMNVDVEGHEYDVFLGFDLMKYRPSIISVEYLDLKMKQLEFKNNDIYRILDSDLYKFLTDNNYFLVNWLHGDLIFVNREFRD